MKDRSPSDPHLMVAADILNNERVEIYDVTNGNRFSTYAIPGIPGAGEVCLNGAGGSPSNSRGSRHYLYLRRLPPKPRLAITRLPWSLSTSTTDRLNDAESACPPKEAL